MVVPFPCGRSLQLGLHGAQRGEDIDEKVGEGENQTDHAADEENGDGGRDIDRQQHGGEKHENEQSGSKKGEADENDGPADPHRALCDDGELLLTRRRTFVRCELTRPVNDAAEAIGHAEQEQSVGRKKDDGTDGELQSLEQIARVQKDQRT